MIARAALLSDQRSLAPLSTLSAIIDAAPRCRCCCYGSYCPEGLIACCCRYRSRRLSMNIGSKPQPPRARMTVLRELLMTFTRFDLQCGALDLLTAINVPGGTKASIVESLISPSHRRRDVCLYFLKKARKSTIDSLIPHKGNTKSMSMETFLHNALAGPVPPAHDHRGGADDQGTHVVDMLVQFDHSVPARKLMKHWRKQWRKKVKAKRITDSLDEVLHNSHPCRTLKNIKREVARLAGCSLDRGAAYVFFYKKLWKKLGRPPSRKRRRVTRKPKYTFVTGQELPPERERIALWKNDDWRWKYELMDTPQIRRHYKKLKEAHRADDTSSDEW